MSEIMNSSSMWIVCGLMVVVILGQSALFLKKALKRAKEIGITDEQVKSSMRSAMISSIGPSLSPVLVILSLVVVLGGPMTWMRMNDVGAARTELGMASVAAEVVGGDLTLGAAGATEETVAAIAWGAALNNGGWMLVALFLTSSMSGLLTKMNSRFDPKWVKLLMSGSTVGLFAYYLCNYAIGKPSPNVVAEIVAAVSMLVINKVSGKYRWLKEPGLGICMILGMAAGSIWSSIAV